MFSIKFLAKNSYKRTVKKYENIRNRKSSKELKRRSERKASEGIFIHQYSEWK